MSHIGCFFEKTNLPRKKNTRSCKFRLPWQSEFSPIEFLKDVADKVTKAICLRSARKSSNRGSSSMGRSKPIGVSVDYYRTAAVEDCIEFIHSSFSRSNSVTATPGEEFPHTFLRNFESQTVKLKIKECLLLYFSVYPLECVKVYKIIMMSPEEYCLIYHMCTIYVSIQT